MPPGTDAAEPERDAAAKRKASHFSGLREVHATYDLRVDEHRVDASRYRSAARKALPSLLVVFVPMVLLIFTDRIVLLYFGADVMEDTGIGTTDMGKANLAYYSAYILLALPSLLVARRFSIRIWLTILLALMGVTTILMSTIQPGMSLVLLQLSLGATSAGLFPILYYYFDLFFSPRDAITAWTAVVLPTTHLGNTLGGPLMQLLNWAVDGNSGLNGWQWMFIINGALTLLVALAVLAALPQLPAEADIFSQEERQAVLKVKESVSGLANAEKDATLLSALGSWKPWYAGVAAMLGNSVYILLVFLVPIVIDELLAETGLVGKSKGMFHAILSGMYSLFAAVSLISQSFALRRGSLSWRLPSGVGMLAIAWMLALTIPLSMAAPSVIITYIHLAAFHTVYTPFLYLDALPALYMQEHGAAAGAFAIYSSVKNISSIFAPPIASYVLGSFSVGTAMQIYATVVLLPCALLFAGFYYGVEPRKAVVLRVAQPGGEADTAGAKAC